MTIERKWILGTSKIDGKILINVLGKIKNESRVLIQIIYKWKKYEHNIYMKAKDDIKGMF